MIAGDEGALRGLAGPTDQFIGEKFCDGRFQFSLRIGFAVWGQKEPGVVRLARITAREVLAVVQQQVPVPLLREARLCRLSNQLLAVGIVTGRVGPGWAGDQHEGKSKTNR